MKLFEAWSGLSGRSVHSLGPDAGSWDGRVGIGPRWQLLGGKLDSGAQETGHGREQRRQKSPLNPTSSQNCLLDTPQSRNHWLSPSCESRPPLPGTGPWEARDACFCVFSIEASSSTGLASFRSPRDLSEPVLSLSSSQTPQHGSLVMFCCPRLGTQTPPSPPYLSQEP